jgi:hypothetical protein
VNDSVSWVIAIANQSLPRFNGWQLHPGVYKLSSIGRKLAPDEWKLAPVGMRLTSSGRKIAPNGLGYKSDVICQKPILFRVIPYQGGAVSNTLDLDSALGTPKIGRRFHSPNRSTLHNEQRFQILIKCLKLVIGGGGREGRSLDQLS